MDEFRAGDTVRVSWDRGAQGTVTEVDDSDGSAWVEFPGGAADWFALSELRLVRKG